MAPRCFAVRCIWVWIEPDITRTGRRRRSNGTGVQLTGHTLVLGRPRTRQTRQVAFLTDPAAIHIEPVVTQTFRWRRPAFQRRVGSACDTVRITTALAGQAGVVTLDLDAVGAVWRGVEALLANAHSIHQLRISINTGQTVVGREPTARLTGIVAVKWLALKRCRVDLEPIDTDTRTWSWTGELGVQSTSHTVFGVWSVTGRARLMTLAGDTVVRLGIWHVAWSAATLIRNRALQ
jgi:hypothetical protein